MGIKKVIIFLALFIYFFNGYIPAYGYYRYIPEFICDNALELYKEGRLEDALSEFKRALLVEPNYEEARKYVAIIEQALSSSARVNLGTQEVTCEYSEINEVPVKNKKELVNDALSKIEANYQKKESTEENYVFVKTPVVVTARPVTKVVVDSPYAKSAVQTVSSSVSNVMEVERLPVSLIELNQNIQNLKSPIELEKDKFLLIKGQQISRFLVINPSILKIDKVSADELKVECMDYGYTYVHVWDSQGRWTLEFLGTAPKYVAENWAQELQEKQLKEGSFKLRYSMDWTSFETGRSLREIDRTSYTWSHWLTLNGQTPYGDFDSQASIRTLKTSTDLTYFTVGLENGKIGDFHDFSIRGFDYAPSISNLILSSPALRGVKFSSYAFDKKLFYTTFWGREGGGRYAGLSPGLSKIRNSYLSGINVNYSPFEKQNYDFTVSRGWGRQRLSDLNEYGYDLKFGQGFDKWKLNYEIANDSERFAHLLTATYSVPRFNLISEFRNTDKAFHTMTGGGWRAGEMGLLTNFGYKPTDRLDLSGRLDVFLDKLYPNPKDNDRWNENLNLDANYSIDALTNLRLDYSMLNELGRLSPIRTYSAGAGVYRTLDWFKRISTYVNYRHQESKHYTSSSNDFINEKVITGVRFNLLKDIYYYCSYEYNWLEARYEGVMSNPQALEMGIDWNRRIGNTPFYSNMRFTYRDEEDTVAPLSFMSGEDYIEGYLELAYRPTSTMEAYCSARIRNIWADNPDINQRVEANFYGGLRYTWDTGFCWNPVGSINGVIFKDYNYDGIKQQNEEGIDGVTVIVLDKKFTTDISGEFGFKDIKSKKVTVSVDASTIPAGFVMTTPISNEVAISHGRTTRVYFGLVSRTELTGMVYEDVNGNNEFDAKDRPVKGVIISLDGASQSVTDDAGKYVFNKVSVGAHKVKLDLNSLPTQYIPKVEIFKEIEISEGSSYIHNFPLEAQKE